MKIELKREKIVYNERLNNQIQLNIQNNSNDTSLLDHIEEGPVHKMLNLAKESRLLDMYEEKMIDIIHVFSRLVLANIIGKRKWNKRSHILQLSNYITESDESFGIVCLENNCFKWEQEFNSPGLPKKDRVMSKWSEGENGQGRYWRPEGMMRFMVLQKTIEKYRHEYNEDYREFEDEILKRETETNYNNVRKRRKVVNENGDIVSGDDSNNDNVSDELEDFLKRCG